MSEIPASELSPGIGDVNAIVKRRQTFVWMFLLVGIGVPVVAYTGCTVFGSPASGSKIEQARRSQATADAAKAPVADTTAEALTGQVRDAKALSDQAQQDNVQLKSQVNQLTQQLQAQHDDAQHTVTVLSHALQTRTPADGLGPSVDGGASGAVPNLAQGAGTAPHLLRNARNPFAPALNVLDGASSGAASGAGSQDDGSAGVAAPRRTMSVIRATAAGADGARSGADGSRSGASSSGVSGSAMGAGSLSGGAGGPPKSFFTGQLEVFESAKFVPPNAYAQAKVLVGVDAATGTTFSADPKPVMFRITGPAIHVGSTGKFQSTDLTGCMVNGAAFGELPSEKVYIKLQKITCPAGPDHFSVAVVEGYVSSKGKAGVRGTVISREGTLTSRALIAGTLNGLGQALSTNVQRSVSGVNTGGSSLLSTRELSTSQIAQGAVGTGVSGAASMLADYYIKRAEQYQPVIEMPTGISVELVFLSGFQVK